MDDAPDYQKIFSSEHSLHVRIIPGSAKTEIISLMNDNQTWKIRVAAPPEKGKANAELVKFFKKELSLHIEVISGKTHRTKLLKIIS